MTDLYPEQDFPWNFYFNGELMPKWGSCWSLARMSSYLRPAAHWDRDIGHRDIYAVECRIDHVGKVESEDVDVFIYVVQEVLSILLAHRDAIVAGLPQPHDTIYSGLLETAFRMRQLAAEQQRAFWTSGYEADRLRLLEVMDRCRLPSNSPRFLLPPHLENRRSKALSAREQQVRKFRQLAQSGALPKDIRKKLHDLR